MNTEKTYYDDLRALARNERQLYGVSTDRFGLREVRAIYKDKGITIDSRDLTNRIRAIYMCSDGECSVAIRKSLPDEPKIFSLMHELKHHLCDQESINRGMLICGDWNENEIIEKGAEVFAAEFIYPEDEFLAHVAAMKVDTWQADDLVHFKNKSCPAKVSYTFLQKRFSRAGLIKKDQFLGFQFKKREEQLYGVPIYKQPWFRNRRRMRATSQA